MPAYLFCIGTNEEREQNLLLARVKLTELFPSVRFSDEMETAPLNTSNPAMFTNQVGFFVSDLKLKEVRRCLKNIEKEAGRRPKDKATGKVLLDIDLLMCDDQILKEDDMVTDHVTKGLLQLRKQLTE